MLREATEADVELILQFIRSNDTQSLKKYLSQLTSLNLSRSNIDAVGIALLAQGLEDNQTLIRLDLSYPPNNPTCQS